MANYISADGGGTKLLAVRFNDALGYEAQGLGGSINNNFTPMDTIREHMRECMSECIGLCGEIRKVYSAIVGPTKVMLEEARKLADIEEQQTLTEGQMSLYAGACVKYGVLLQAGTGSDVFAIQPTENYTVGGWGSILGDEGSGYDIGVRAIHAMIKARDGRAPKTIMTQMLLDEWKIGELWEIVTPIYSNPQQRAQIASVARIAGRAAREGDEAALEIYRHAAKEFYDMTLAVLAHYDNKYIGPIVPSGSAWKGTPVMFETYKELILKTLPRAEFVYPMYEPVIGGVVAYAFERGMEREEILKALNENFSAYKYI